MSFYFSSISFLLCHTRVLICGRLEVKKKITKSNLVCPVNAGRSFVPVWLSSVPTLVADQKLAYV